MTTQAVIFDLDGTLIDSLADIAAATNACLAEAGLPQHPESDYPAFVGHGIGMLIHRAMGEHASATQEAALVQAVADRYRQHCTLRTRPYEGINALLTELRARDIAMAVVSNKPDDMTQQIVDALWDSEFGFVTGERAAVPRKPDPTGILTACDTLGIAPGSALYVGDTSIDVQAAANAGVRSVAVTWGFRSAEHLRAARPDHLVDTPAEILDCL